MDYPVDPALDMGPDGKFKDPDPGTGDPGSVWPALKGSVQLFDELKHVIEQAGLTADENNLTQVYQAIQALIAAGAGVGGVISELELANAADAQHDITFSAGQASAKTADAVIKLPADLTKQLDAVWAEGDNLGGRFPPGGVGTNGVYHCFVIEEDGTGNVDAGFDTDIDAANRPVGWSKYRRVGTVLTDNSANIYPFWQVGNWFMLQSRQTIISLGARGGAVESQHTFLVPQDFECISITHAFAIASDTSGPAVEVRNALSLTGGGRHFVTENTHPMQMGADHFSRTDSLGRGVLYNQFPVSSIAIEQIGWIDKRE